MDIVLSTIFFATVTKGPFYHLERRDIAREVDRITTEKTNLFKGETA